MNYLNWSRYVLSFLIDLLFLLVLSCDAKDRIEKAKEKKQRTAAPEPAAENTDE